MRFVAVLLFVAVLAFACVTPSATSIDLAKCEYVPRAARINGVYMDIWACEAKTMVMRPSLDQANKYKF